MGPGKQCSSNLSAKGGGGGGGGGVLSFPVASLSSVLLLSFSWLSLSSFPAPVLSFLAALFSFFFPLAARLSSSRLALLALLWLRPPFHPCLGVLPPLIPTCFVCVASRFLSGPGPSIAYDPPARFRPQTSPVSCRARTRRGKRGGGGGAFAFVRGRAVPRAVPCVAGVRG